MIDTLSNLDTSLETMSILDERYEKDITLDEYARRAITMIEKVKNIIIPEDFRQDLQVTERAAVKNITFLVERPKYESAMAEVIKALELLSKIDLSYVPEKSMEKNVKLLLAICTDCNKHV